MSFMDELCKPIPPWETFEGRREERYDRARIRREEAEGLERDRLRQLKNTAGKPAQQEK